MIHGDGDILTLDSTSDGTPDGMARDGVIIIRDGVLDGVVDGIRTGDVAEDGIPVADITIRLTNTLTDAAQPDITQADAVAEHPVRTTDLTGIQADVRL